MMARANQRGSMLLFVLFITGVLGVLAAVGAAVMKAGADSSRVFAERLRADEAMRGAIEYIIGQTGAGIRQARGTAVVQMGNARVFISVHDEAARIDLNRAPRELLVGILKQVGVAPDAAEVYASRIIDWRDDDDTPSPPGGAERPAYQAAGRDGPRNGRFLDPAELTRVLGMPPRVAAALTPYVTVASGLDRINPLTADPPVLMSLPGATVTTVRKFLDERQRIGVPFAVLTAALGRVQEFVTDETGNAVRFEARVELAPDYVRQYEAVAVVQPGDAEPYRYLAWDASPPPRTQTLP
jgi:general secretion pathway protein K